MPKLINNLREEILANGRKLLLEKGYKALTMRVVASECHVATGTLYNYYESKDMLVAGIMLEDWINAIAEGSKNTANADSCIDGLGAVFSMISEFSARYRSVWQESSGNAYTSGEYHERIINQLASLIRPLLFRFSALGEPDQSVFLAEILLHAASQNRFGFENLRPFIIKLI